MGVFSGSIVYPPEELIVAGSRTPSPKTRASTLVGNFLDGNPAAVSVRIGTDDGVLAYSHSNHSAFNPR